MSKSAKASAKLKKKFCSANFLARFLLSLQMKMTRREFAATSTTWLLVAVLAGTGNASADGGVPDTLRIQPIIDSTAATGGGTVSIPRGEWVTGRITLRSNITIDIPEDAILYFSGDMKDYQPDVMTRYEGTDVSSLGAMIYAYGDENISITGKGVLIAPPYDSEVGRITGRNGIYPPTFFGPVNCTNITVDGPTFIGSVFWNIAPTYCKGITIRNVTVRSYGRGRTDGVDIDSSTDAVIENCTFDCGDDCIALKAGRGEDGLRRGMPTENVTISKCTFLRGVGGIAIGSETAGMIRNVRAYDCTFKATQYPFYLKTRRPRGGGAEDIVMERMHIDSCKAAAIHIDMLGSRAWVGEMAERHFNEEQGAGQDETDIVVNLSPVFRNITFRNITIERCKMIISAKGLPEEPIEGLVIENVAAPTNAINLQDVGTFSFY